ncbi:MAG: hypothetical protein ABIS00_11550 [Gemmatimonadales bacterium]
MPAISPPLPKCTFRVAIAGHRPDRLPPESEGPLETFIRRALITIRAEVHHHAGRPGSGYQPGAPELVVLSGLAAGTDQIGARAAIATSGWLLHAVLPFAEDEYARDFRDDPDALRQYRRLLQRADHLTVLDGRARVAPDGERGFDAYAPLARVLVDQCDLLLVVWDGSPARGPGGTATMVQAARQADVPILHFNPRAPRRIRLETRPDVPEPDDWSTALREQVGRLLAPPDAAKSHRGEEVDLRKEYFEETLPPARRATLFDLIGSAFHRRPGDSSWLPRIANTILRMVRLSPIPHPIDAAQTSWEEQWIGMSASARTLAAEHFAAHYGWADALATRYASEFRATYSRVFALAWLAVVAAFVGTIAEGWGGEAGHSPTAAVIHTICLSAEALVLMVVFANVYWGRRGRLHERWLDYRALAERLRHLGVLWAIGRTTPAVRLPAIILSGDPRTSWVGWYLRSVAREAGLITGVFDHGHLESCRLLLRNEEIDRQQRFHASARDRGRAIVHPLERLAEGLFLVALLIALGNLLHAPERILSRWITNPGMTAAILGAIGVGLPALASAIHGFLGTSDFESIAIRSAGVAPRLQELIWRLDHLDPIDSTSIGEIGAEAARIMEGELGSWRAVTAARKLTAV